MSFVDGLWSAIVNQVSRGKLTMAAYSAGGQRTMLQGLGLAGETHQGIELLLPYGMSAIPTGLTGDYVLVQVGAVRDHKVAIALDDPALRIPDLAAGEIGFRNSRGSQVVFRTNKIEVTAPLDDIDITAAQGNVNVAATEGAVGVSSKGAVTVTISAGNLVVGVTGNVTIAATGSIALTAPANQITANGHVLG